MRIARPSWYDVEWEQPDSVNWPLQAFQQTAERSQPSNLSYHLNYRKCLLSDCLANTSTRTRTREYHFGAFQRVDPQRASWKKFKRRCQSDEWLVSERNLSARQLGLLRLSRSIPLSLRLSSILLYSLKVWSTLQSVGLESCEAGFSLIREWYGNRKQC